jgi:hypothetical protein
MDTIPYLNDPENSANMTSVIDDHARFTIETARKKSKFRVIMMFRKRIWEMVSGRYSEDTQSNRSIFPKYFSVCTTPTGDKPRHSAAMTDRR